MNGRFFQPFYSRAAPTALHKHNICVGKSVTSYPAMKDKMTADGKYEYKEERVVVDGN